MDTNPYQAPESDALNDSSIRLYDRDQCPACSFRQPIWKVINFVGRYQCPSCSAELVVRLDRRVRLISFMIELAICLPALFMFYHLDKSNMGYVITYSGISTFILIALGTFYFPWQFGYLDQK